MRYGLCAFPSTLSTENEKEGIIIMSSIAIENGYKAHLFYKNRMNTDTLFALPHGSVSMSGELDRAIRFIEDYQLIDAPLWVKFVNQFRETVPKADDHDNGWRGEYWGKMMRGACFTYQYTQNEVLYNVLADTVRDMMSAADRNGRISSYSYAKQYNGWDIWARKYVLLGMQYFIEICKDERFIEEIIDSMKGQADYLLSTIGPESEGKKEITKATSHWLGMNSSSILEPIVRLYNLTGEQKYFDFATYIVDSGVISTPGVSIFEMAYENKLPLHKYPVVKAYEMMSNFEGLIEYYRVTGNEKWKQACINFAKRVCAEEISAIGSSGCTHELFDHTLVRQTNTKYHGPVQETCVTVTWMKFCYQMLSLTGDSTFADQIEKSIYNALIGAINYKKYDKNGGFPFDSYSPLLFNTRLRGVGGKKTMADGTAYGCCACIGAAGTGLIGMVSSMLSKSGVVLNLYSNGTVNATTPTGERIELKISTEYPADGIVNVEVMSDADSAYSIDLRIPEWSKKTLVSANGEKIDAKNGEYVSINRVWKKGDYITLALDMRCELIKAVPDPMDENSAYHVSLRRGPITLARDKRIDGNIESIVDFAPDEEGYVPCKLAKTAICDSNQTFIVTESNGNAFEMINYSSAGATWGEDSMATVWMPTKNYWEVDITKPITISCPNCSWADNGDVCVVCIDENGNPVVVLNGSEKFIIEDQHDGNCKIKAVSVGKYLDVSKNGEKAVLTDEGSLWKIAKYAQNKYRIYDHNGRALTGSNLVSGVRGTATADVLTFSAPSSLTTLQVFRFEN